MFIARRVKPLLLAFGTMAGGCETLTTPDCTLEAVPGIVVEIRNARNGELVADNALVIARDGAFVDSAAVTGTSSPVPLAHERPGTYQVTVQKEGFQPWTARSVVVKDGSCHVKTAKITARIEPLP